MPVLNNLKIFIVYISAFLVQTTWLSKLPLGAASPNLILCAMLFLFFCSDRKLVFVLAILFGLLSDIGLGVIWGASAMCYFVVALLLMVSAEKIYKNHMPTVLMATAIAVTVYELLYWFIIWAFGFNYGFVAMLAHLPLSIVINTAITGLFKGLRG